MTELMHIREDQVPDAADHLLAREVVWPRAAAALGCLAFGLAALAFAAFGLVQGAIAAPVMFGFGGLCLVLIGRGFQGGWQAARRTTNWRLRATPDGLFVKIRSFLNHALPAEDPVVLFVPRRRVAWLRRHDQRMVTSGTSKNSMTVKRGCLEIKVDGTLDALDRAIALERQRWIPTRMGRKRHGHYPVSVVPGGIVRIDWHGPDTALRPKLDAALADLAGRFGYRRAGAAQTARGSVLAGAGPEHERQLLEHAQRGETMQAIELARALYGYDLTEAKRFVEELKAGGPGTE